MFDALGDEDHVAGLDLAALVGDLLFALATDHVQELVAVGVGVALVALAGFEPYDTGTEPVATGNVGGCQPLQDTPVEHLALHVVRSDEVLRHRSMSLNSRA